MYADGFLNQRQRHPYAMGAAIALNLAGVAAVMLAKSGYVPIPVTRITAYPVPLPSPPPPHIVEQPKPPKAHATPIPQPSPQPQPTPQVDTSRSAGNTTTGTTAGGGTVEPPTLPTPTPAPSTTPEPVLTGPIQIGTDAQPAYPPSLQRQGVEGAVVVRVLIGTDGRVKQVEIVSSDDPAFADATERQALRRWRFRPATRDGVPVESWKKLTVRFQLKR